MTRDDIIRMAREAGGLDLLCANHGFTDTLEAFAHLVAAAEREACAKVCDRLASGYLQYAADDCAAAIRARGENK